MTVHSTYDLADVKTAVDVVQSAEKAKGKVFLTSYKKIPSKHKLRGGACFLFTYIRTAVPLTATINMPSRTTS